MKPWRRADCEHYRLFELPRIALFTPRVCRVTVGNAELRVKHFPPKLHSPIRYATLYIVDLPGHSDHAGVAVPGTRQH